mgnify:CR=1 FL=1
MIGLKTVKRKIDNILAADVVEKERKKRLGCTYAIREAFDAASVGVLFIDEAYSLQTDTAVTVLIHEMENRRDVAIVILAGYSERMKSLIELNEGLKSRIPYWIDFPDYDTDELTEIFSKKGNANI